jgi:subtilisin family serine protease
MLARTALLGGATSGTAEGGAGRSHANGSVTPLELIKLRALMALSSGSREVAVALMDGPVATSHPDLAGASIRDVAGGQPGTCTQLQSSACAHGTFVAGMLAARRGSTAPAICPDCTLLLRPIFRESASSGHMPAATPEELAQAIVEFVDPGARVLNLSAATGEPSTKVERRLQESLDYAARRGALVVAAAGNQGTLGGSAITRHPWVIPVVAYDSRGRPMSESNLGASMGRRGLGAPGEAIESVGATGAPLTLSGTSFAAPFVSGAIALLWSEFPAASAVEIRRAVTGSRRRSAVAPPLLDAWAAYRAMATSF